MQVPACEHLFVYGTLRPGLAPAALRSLVDRFRFVGRGSTAGLLFDLGPYPGAVFAPAAQSLIWGEVCQLPDDPSVLAALDEYEGYRAGDPAGSLYQRVRCIVTLAADGAIECWGYAYQRDVRTARLVPDGDYMKWRSEQRALRGNTSRKPE